MECNACPQRLVSPAHLQGKQSKFLGQPLYRFVLRTMNLIDKGHAEKLAVWLQIRGLSPSSSIEEVQRALEDAGVPVKSVVLDDLVKTAPKKTAYVRLQVWGNTGQVHDCMVCCIGADWLCVGDSLCMRMARESTTAPCQHNYKVAMQMRFR